MQLRQGRGTGIPGRRDKEPAGTSGRQRPERRRLRNRVQQPRTRPGLADIFHQPSCRTLISTTMTYFQNIQSLADLKKEYRRLAVLSPDRG